MKRDALYNMWYALPVVTTRKSYPVNGYKNLLEQVITWDNEGATV
jgi:hypothetical protein